MRAYIGLPAPLKDNSNNSNNNTHIWWRKYSWQTLRRGNLCDTEKEHHMKRLHGVMVDLYQNYHGNIFLGTPMRMSSRKFKLWTQHKCEQLHHMSLGPKPNNKRRQWAATWRWLFWFLTGTMRPVVLHFHQGSSPLWQKISSNYRPKYASFKLLHHRKKTSETRKRSETHSALECNWGA